VFPSIYGRAAERSPHPIAVAFLAHGWLFLMPPAHLVEQMNASLPRWFQLFLGVAEVLAAVGLTLPGLTRILPWLGRSTEPAPP
jgi:uncharacterized membrane protein YphA (DoxX/SURF4 family)